MRYAAFLAIFAVLLAIAVMAFPLILDEADISDENFDEITLLFAGDIMLDRGVKHYIEKNNDWKWPFRNIADFLNEADLVFGNLESMISDKGYNVGSIYSFRADPKTIDGLVFAGFDVLSVANNHSFDYTKEAFKDTLKRLEEADITYVGGGFTEEEAYRPAVKNIKGIKIGFLGYTSVGSSSWQARGDSPGIAWTDGNFLDRLREDIAKAKEECDILIVSVHFGSEYQKTPGGDQRLIAETSVESGADIVVGHHPHVVQPLERYRDGWIAYSLGNFVFDQYFSEETMRGAILKVELKGREIEKVELMATEISSEYQVSLR